MMSIYPIVRIQLSFVQFLLLCYEFCILSKTECVSIYYHFKRDHESSSYRKLARNKWICRETFDFLVKIELNLKLKQDINLSFWHLKQWNYLEVLKDYWKLDITEVLLVYCNIVNNDCQQDLRVLYTFVPNIPFSSLLEISPENHIFLKTFKSEFQVIRV